MLLRYREALLGLAEKHKVAVVEFYSVWHELEASEKDIHSYLANRFNHLIERPINGWQRGCSVLFWVRHKSLA